MYLSCLFLQLLVMPELMGLTFGLRPCPYLMSSLMALKVRLVKAEVFADLLMLWVGLPQPLLLAFPLAAHCSVRPPS